MTNKFIYETIDEYLRQFPDNIREQLIILRNLIKSIAPEAKEIISWGMPTFYYHGNLVHFAANKNHIGFYPGADCVELFINDLGPYKHSKGAIQFPYGIDIPSHIIREIVLYRMNTNINKHFQK